MPVKTIRIDKIEDLSEILFDHPFNESISRNRDLYLYRGLPDTSFSLISSLQRICKNKSQELEMGILDNFAKYAELEDSSISKSIWRKMILGQHHGLPTRLLDWTRSPLIALNFATTEGDMDNLDKRDCVVWRIDAAKLHQYLPKKYQDVIAEHNQRIFTVDMLAEVCDNLEQYDKDMKGSHLAILEPPSMDSRMMNQYSFFSVMPYGSKKAEDLFEKLDDVAVRYIINKNIRWQIRDFLDSSNVNERIVYPGLDGIAQWIARHYYVRNSGRLHIEKISLPKLDADVIVNSTDCNFKMDGKVATAVKKYAGPEFIKHCDEVHYLETGSILVTDGFDLKAKKIIHACTPDWEKHKRTQNDPLLVKLYRDSLQYVLDNDYHSIGFPLLSSGSKGYPIDMAWMMALRACQDFLTEHQGYPLDITFCVLKEEMYAFGQYFLNDVNGVKTSKEELKYLQDLIKMKD